MRTIADIFFKSSISEIIIKLMVTIIRFSKVISDNFIKSDISQNSKIIGINIMPPILGFAFVCKDLLFGMSCILENKFKAKIEDVAKTVEANEKSSTKNKVELSKCIT